MNGSDICEYKSRLNDLFRWKTEGENESKTDRKREAAKGCSANSQLHISTWVTHVISSREKKNTETHAHTQTHKEGQ